MDPAADAKSLSRNGPPRPLRARHGAWIQPAETVFELVKTHGWGVSDAVRKVIAKRGYKDKQRAFHGIRAAYYVLRDKAAEEEFAL